jgi:putative DNA primase/helicase
LLVPMRLDGRTVSLQEIDADGTARFLSGGRTAGATFTMGSGRGEVLCVGYAAALSIRAALSALCLPARVTCCFTAENMAAIAAHRRQAVIFAEHDANALHTSEGLPALQRLLLDLLQARRGQAA